MDTSKDEREASVLGTADCNEGLDGTERYAFGHARNGAELARRIDFGLDPVADPLLQCCDEEFLPFVLHVIDGRIRKLHHSLCV